MNIEEFRSYCLAKSGVEETFPFDHKTIVFKVGGKMFALSDVEEFDAINLKCDPERAVELREHYDSVTPGYHMNKKHWNTVTINGDLNDHEIYALVDHSYEIVVNGLPKRLRNEL